MNRNTALCIALGLFPALPAVAGSYSFQAINDCQPNGINDAGVVVGLCNGPLIQGFIYSSGTTTIVADPQAPNGNTLLYGINNAGVIVGSSDVRTFWLKDGIFHTITEATASAILQAEGIDNHGAIAGWRSTQAGTFGFILASGHVTKLASPANSINDAGDVVGTVLESDVGYQIIGGTYATVTVPNAAYTYPSGINDHQTISGWYDDQENNAHGFVLRNGTVTTIDYPGADFTRLGGINQSGQVVGFALTGNSLIGFVATPTP